MTGVHRSRRWRVLVALGALVLAVVAAGCGSPSGVAKVASGAPGVSETPSGPPEHPASRSISHVFVIVVENESYAATYHGTDDPYLSHTLRRQGTLLTSYDAIGHDSADNYLAMISGQAPNVATSADCRDDTPFVPTDGDRLDARGQIAGTGCRYPSVVQTIGNQLTAAHRSWQGFMQDMGNDPQREQPRCGQPTTAVPDDTQHAVPGDQYAARHNPFVYFASLTRSGLCAAHVTGLAPLASDLTAAGTTPDLSFIVPNLCNDGHDSPCVGRDVAGSRAGGLVSVDHFLERWVPRIEASPAFAHGLLVITSDESVDSDTASCCGERPGPSDPFPGRYVDTPGHGAGGGRVGALLIGPCVRRDAVDATPYNHYSLLRTMEDLFGLDHGGSDGRGHLGEAGAPGVHAFESDALGCGESP